MKQWVQKLIEQLDFEHEDKKSSKAKSSDKATSKVKLSEDRATLLYLIDVYNKQLIDIDLYPVRKVRDILDGFAKELVNTTEDKSEDVLFRFRQFFNSYRVAESTYVRKSFDDFKGIVWNFVEQLSEDFKSEQAEDNAIHENLQQLKEAVETDSIDLLRSKSKEFIHFYVEQQSKKENRRAKRMKGIRKNLDVVKKQLVDADRSMRIDHLTQAYNRKSFDERARQQAQLFEVSKTQVSMILMDIDFFKKINDTHGHDIGDFVLKECVKTLQNIFGRESDFVARIGGEEFAVILPDHAIEHAVIRAEEALTRIRKEVYVMGSTELRFTVSMGIAQLLENETVSQWIKRADAALYESKQSGRNRYTISTGPRLSQVA